MYLKLLCPVLNFRIYLGSDIDGQEDTRHICGIIVAEEKVKLVKGDKVYSNL